MIYKALRKPVRVSGIGEFNRTTSELMTLHVDSVETVEPVKIGSVDFDAGRSLKDLIKEQGIRPLRTIKNLQGGIAEDEPLDELLEEIYTTRS